MSHSGSRWNASVFCKTWETRCTALTQCNAIIFSRSKQPFLVLRLNWILRLVQHLAAEETKILMKSLCFKRDCASSLTIFPRCCAERVSRRVKTLPQTEISLQTPGLESWVKPFRGCITSTPLVVSPSIWPSDVFHLAAFSWRRQGHGRMWWERGKLKY